jgi:hypothetical protein
MIVTGPCGHTYDDAAKDTKCPHYPIEAPPRAYCKTHDLFRPCVCCDQDMRRKAVGANLAPQSPADAERYPIAQAA